MFTLEEFVASPTIAALSQVTRDQLVMIAGHYKIGVTGSPAKAELLKILIDSLSAGGVLESVGDDEAMGGAKPVPLPETPSTPSISKADLELRRLQLREKEIEWEREKSNLEADRLLIREREKREHELRMKDLEINQALRLKELEIRARESGLVPSEHFDVTRNIRLVPPFNESEVDKFFAHFERVATVMKWPRNVWTITLQSIFKGKAQQAYSSLSLADAADYDKVKEAVLRIYSLVPEAYRHKYRDYHKPESLTYVEFLREKEILFDRWLSSQNVTTFDALRDLILLEDFKNCLPRSVATYLGEHKVLKPADAAVRADEYVLAHKGATCCPTEPQYVASQNILPVKETVAELDQSVVNRVTRSNQFCEYCKKRGHVLAECFKLKRVNSSCTTAEANCVSLLSPTSRKDENFSQAFAPFITDAVVTLPGAQGIGVPIKVLRDTAASQSFVLESVLPFNDKSYAGENVLVQGFEMGSVAVPLYRVSLISDLITGEFKVGVRPSLPVNQVHLLLGNDIMGGVVFPRLVVTNTAEAESPDQLTVEYPEIFHTDVVTRAMSKKAHETSVKDSRDEFELFNSFIARPLSGSGETPKRSAPLSMLSCLPDKSLSREQFLQIVVPPAPLQPILVVSETFEHVVLGRVGELPRTKTGKEYILTIMCTLTRFPGAVPLSEISASVIIKALVMFFSLFALPKVVQTDQRTNFMSSMFTKLCNN
ncbi:hypothetical protein ACEWY4_006059 [Coilia grayii]|uniref:Integrase catalytic domain-containing protein n=1 Tax=Coilia grayii TaxID=363190 RepID=A0ABD1KCF8_9TELE